MTENKDQVFTAWSESAQFWDKHRSARRAMFDPLIPAIRDEAGMPECAVDRPYQVLDIAAGPGDLAIGLAEMLGQQATVSCTDLVPDMVKIAERTAAERGMHNLRFQESRAENLPFESDSFDAVVCRFGIMFFSDPVVAVRESLRVLKPRCRVVHCVWGTRQANPFHNAVQDVLDRYVPGPSPDPDAPGAFRFAKPGKLADVFKLANAADVRERVFRFNIAAPLSFDHFFEVRTEMSDSLRAKLRKLPEEQRTSFKEDVRQNAQPYFSSSGFSFPAEVLLISGAK
jgi:SAM-dependent methyltransferase